MEVKELNQSDFAQMLKSADAATYQTAFENDVWYEKVTDGEVTYCHKLISLKEMGADTLSKKALESQPSTEPIRLRAQNNGPVIALAFNSKATVYYHLLKGTKSEMAQAKRLVIYFAKSLLHNFITQQPETTSVAVTE